MSLPRPTRADERLLLAHALGVPLCRLAFATDATAEQLDVYERLLAQRATGVPVQHLTGEAHFRTVTVEVGPGVFIPRPETELMVGWALERLRPGNRVVELCAGSGAISLSLATELSGLELHAVELSDAAVAFAARNLAGTGIDLREGDMADAFGELDGTVDLVIANPPYVPLSVWDGVPAEVRDFDPHLALFSGDDGLDAMRVVTGVADRLLRLGGWLTAEHAEVQSDAVVGLFVEAGFSDVRDHRDLTDRPRFATGRKTARGRMSP